MPPMLLNYDRLAAASKIIEPTQPIFMLNLIRFNDIATYDSSDPAFSSLPKISGREAYYSRYVATLQPRMPQSSSILFVGNTVANILAETSSPGDTKDGHFGGGNGGGIGKVDLEWDVAAIIKYETFQDFRDMVENEQYKKEAMPHRIASIKEYKLIICEEMKF